MEAYGYGKVLGSRPNKLMLPPLINRDLLMSQCGLFKTCMKSSVRKTMLLLFDLNPLTKVWRVLDNNNNVTKNFSELIKLAEISMIHVIGLVEDENTFLSLVFLKSKLKAILVENLEVAMECISKKNSHLKIFLTKRHLKNGSIQE